MWCSCVEMKILFIVYDSKSMIQIVYIQIIQNRFWCEIHIMYPVSETKLVIMVFVSWKIEAFNHLILPLLLVPEWPYWPPNSSGLHFIKQYKCYFTLNVEFSISKPRTHFFKECTFFSCNTFSVTATGLEPTTT